MSCYFSKTECNEKCDEFRSKVACENDVINLVCHPGQRVAIFSASFGRTEYESLQCPQPHDVKEETCMASYATETVMNLCHGKRRCSVVANSSTFGEPCSPESRTYLKVVYTCDTVPKTRYSHVQTGKENCQRYNTANNSNEFGSLIVLIDACDFFLAIMDFDVDKQRVVIKFTFFIFTKSVHLTGHASIPDDTESAVIESIVGEFRTQIFERAPNLKTNYDNNRSVVNENIYNVKCLMKIERKKVKDRFPSKYLTESLNGMVSLRQFTASDQRFETNSLVTLKIDHPFCPNIVVNGTAHIFGSFDFQQFNSFAVSSERMQKLKSRFPSEKRISRIDIIFAIYLYIILNKRKEYAQYFRIVAILTNKLIKICKMFKPVLLYFKHLTFHKSRNVSFKDTKNVEDYFLRNLERNHSMSDQLCLVLFKRLVGTAVLFVHRFGNLVYYGGKKNVLNNNHQLQKFTECRENLGLIIYKQLIPGSTVISNVKEEYQDGLN
ncbi:hypothetical protein WN51_02130 [Melipona quadrifasciata]|uniref:SUEL-type lectin domain-containing protein n=1 Tax=Melipona quadrifasciata TaxID=166423 RepID=A0A0M8ZV93_9HYME|nr:hypothetical protein WN51_02130 [Melipona quadrifasciata]